MDDPDITPNATSGDASECKDGPIDVPGRSHGATVEASTVEVGPLTGSTTSMTDTASSISGLTSEVSTSITTTTTTTTSAESVSSATNGSTSSNGQNKSQNIPPWRSYNGPKLYVKPVSRTSNQQIIHKAIAKALEGAANANTLKKIQESIQANIKTCNHFLILFRNYQFKGIYDYNEKLATITKLDGLGPKSICLENIVRFFKFDSTKRAFTEVETKQIGPTIIGISLSPFNTK